MYWIKFPNTDRRSENLPKNLLETHTGQITLHAWISEIELGEVFAYDLGKKQFELLNHPFSVPNSLIGVHSE